MITVCVVVWCCVTVSVSDEQQIERMYEMLDSHQKRAAAAAAAAAAALQSSARRDTHTDTHTGARIPVPKQWRLWYFGNGGERRGGAKPRSLRMEVLRSCGSVDV